MSHGLLLTFEITILVLAIFLGFEVISKVPTLLHTPLMSGTNAIHGIVIVGAMLVAGRRPQGHADDDHRADRGRARVGERRRRLRRDRPDARDVQEAGAQRARLVSREATNLLYLVTIVTFILALRFLSNPATARRGNQIGAVGMLVAIVVTFAQNEIVSYWEIAVGMVIGGTFGAVAARKVRMTAMPQMVALFNGVGGGAAALISLAEFHNLAPDPGTLELGHQHVDHALGDHRQHLVRRARWSRSRSCRS